VQFGVQLPQMGRPFDRDTVMSFATRIEQLGFASGWTSDHVCWPATIESRYPYTPDGSFVAPTDLPWLDVIATQAFVAACTERLKLGFSVLILPYRHPVATAKQLATLDVLSNGRLIFGCGIGWMREEAEILGMPFDRRGARVDEQLALFERLFRDERPRFDGEFYRIPEVGFEPKPIQNPLPVWVGGSSEAACRRAARFGTGFHAAFEPLERARGYWATVQAEARRLGRDTEELTFSMRLFLDPNGRMPPEKSVAGSKQQMHDRIGELADAGVRHLVFDAIIEARSPNDRKKAQLELLEHFMTDVGKRYTT
jgi:probable F420-dependent oxidoreductase